MDTGIPEFGMACTYTGSNKSENASRLQLSVCMGTKYSLVFADGMSMKAVGKLIPLGREFSACFIKHTTISSVEG